MTEFWTADSFDCAGNPCQFSWILRDHRELLFPFLRNANCAQGYSFANAPSSLFNNCGVCKILICV